MQPVVLAAVTKVFKRPSGELLPALSELSLGVEDGECLALVGPSGSGKTTALRLIAGLEQPASGTISIGGMVVNGIPPGNRDVAMMFQNPALYPHMTVYENLGFGLRLRKCPGSEADRRVKEAAEVLGLTACLQSRPAILSAGQRQRVALGRALVRRASVVLLDEPLANVDPSLRARMRREIGSLRRELGTTMIYVTHDHLEAMMVGDRVAVLREGQLQQVASPGMLYTRPANLFVAGFLGFPPMNLFRGTLVRRGVDLFFELPVGHPGTNVVAEQGIGLKLPVGATPRLERYSCVLMGLRPEQITCCDGSAEPTDVTLQARLEAVQVLGADTYLHATVAGVEFIARAAPLPGWAAGRDCPFRFDLRQALFFDPSTEELIAP